MLLSQYRERGLLVQYGPRSFSGSSPVGRGLWLLTTWSVVRFHVPEPWEGSVMGTRLSPKESDGGSNPSRPAKIRQSTRIDAKFAKRVLTTGRTCRILNAVEWGNASYDTKCRGSSVVEHLSHKQDRMGSNPIPETKGVLSLGYVNKEQRNTYQREWVAQRRAQYLCDKACVDCGSRNDLEIDHVDKTQKVSHRIWSWSTQRREQELAKCVVRCRRCHQIKTLAHRTDRAEHGTRSKYDFGCRCENCREAQRTYNAEWRKKQRMRVCSIGPAS